jgi:hypothetical protein
MAHPLAAAQKNARQGAMTARNAPVGTVGSMTNYSAAQQRLIDRLLERPTPEPLDAAVLERIEKRLFEATAADLCRWGKSRLYVTKHRLTTLERCEGLLVGEAAQPFGGMSPQAAIGLLAHQSIQLAHTHPGRSVADDVTASVQALVASDDAFAEFWQQTGPVNQSNVQMQAVSFTTTFLDTFPPLSGTFAARFEEAMQAPVGRLVLSARPDLVLGRASDGLLLIDLKTGGLRDEHAGEAAFYALVAALRYRVLPAGSTVYSLASGEWSDPEVTTSMLEETAEKVAAAAVASVKLLADEAAPTLTPGPWCRYCPLRQTCPQSSYRTVAADD